MKKLIRLVLCVVAGGLLMAVGSYGPAHAAAPDIPPPPTPPAWMRSPAPALPQVGVQIIYAGAPPAQAPQIEAFVQALVQEGYLAPESSEGYTSATYLGAVSWPQRQVPVPPQQPSAGGEAYRAGTLAYLPDYMGVADLDHGTWGQTVDLIIPNDGTSWLTGTGDCGFHGDRPPGQMAGEIVFAVAPEPTGGCDSGDSHMGSWTEIISHELIEAIARPYSDQGVYASYYAAWPELADACEEQPTVWYGQWQVVQYEVGGACTFGSYGTAATTSP